MNSVFSKPCVPNLRSLSSLSLGWLCLSGLMLAPDAIAQPQPTQSSSSQLLDFVPPPAPKDEGAPKGRRQGGASRGSCKNYEKLTALVPIQDEVVRGLTQSPNPTLWFYLPAPVSKDLEVEFVLQDQNDDFVYHTDLSFDTDAAGIVSVSVEDAEPALQAGESYQWTLSLDCSPSVSVYVSGRLESVAPVSSVQGLSPFEQAAQAAQDGIWFDSLTALGELRQAEPDNPRFQQAWMNLLQQIDLDDIASKPLL